MPPNPLTPDNHSALVPAPDSLVSVLFPASRSASYPAALALASAADRRVDVSARGGVSHFAEFSRSPAQAAAAVALLSLVGSWRGVLVFAGGLPVGSAWGAVPGVERVLRCYMSASSVSDYRAACWSISSLLMSDGAPNLPAVFPCRHILRVFPTPLSRLLPVPEVDQIASRAADAGCSWCPLLDAAAFRFLPD